MTDDDDDNKPWPPSYFPWPPTMAPVAIGMLANDVGLVRQRLLRELDVEPRQIAYSVEAKWIKRVGRGLYTGPKTTPWQSGPIAQVSLAREKAVLALRDAAMIWGLVPFDDGPAPYFAIANKDRKPTSFAFAVNWLRWSAERLKEGVVIHRFKKVSLQLTTPARTVADYFAHPRRLPPGAAMDLLLAFRRSQHWDEERLRQMAVLCRVTSRVRTALKALNG